MQKLFLKALFFMVVISVSFNLLGTLADKVAPLEDWGMEYEQVESNLRIRNEQIEAITLGNSHADSIDYVVLGIEGQSLAFAAADLFEIEKTVLSLDNQLPNLNRAFVTVSLYSFSRDNGNFDALRPRRVSFYSLVPVWSPIEGDLPNFLMGKVDRYTHVMSVVRSDSWKGVWTALMPNAPVTNPLPYNGVHTSSVWGECSHYTAEQLDTHAREIAGRNISSSIQMAYAHPGLEEDAFDALARTIERLQSRGVEVILYTPAYYDKYNKYFADGGSNILDQTRLAVSKLQQAFGVEYYDFSHDPEFITHPELFYNSEHLNECGSKVISAKLLEQMEENLNSNK